MNNENIVPEQQKGLRVYTKLKFVKSEESGAPVSFVSQNPKTGRICGVRQDSEYPKKIAIVDKMLANEIMMNVLYDCTLIPMSAKNGYVVIAAEPVQFKANVETKYHKGRTYRVEVSFGNKTISFDPFRGQKNTVRHFTECKRLLETRLDVQDINQVVEDFERAASMILKVLRKDIVNYKV